VLHRRLSAKPKTAYAAPPSPTGVRAMPLTMHQALVGSFVPMLEGLSRLLDKGAAYAAARKIDEGVLLGLRLFPDMFPLTRQVQIASDTAKNAAARLAGVEAPKFPDEETSIAALKERIQRTIDYVQGAPAAVIDESAEKEIILPLGATVRLPLTGRSFLLHFALPNFYFHVTTAYDILRHAGVEIGKRDFLAGLKVG
jgi:uncharacterized protein